METLPRIIHQSWMSGNKIRQPYIDFRRTFLEKNIDWTLHLWTMDNVFELPLLPSSRRLLNKNIHYVMKSDIVRYEVLRIFGGMYFDLDMRCLKNLSPLLANRNFASVGYYPNIISNCAIGCLPNDPLITRLCSLVCGIFEAGFENIINKFYLECDSVNSQSVVLQEIRKIYPAEMFCPYKHNEADLNAFRGKDYPNSFTEHLWMGKDSDGWGKTINDT